MTFRYLCLCCGRKFVAEGVIPLAPDGTQLGDEDNIELWSRKVREHWIDPDGYCYAVLDERIKKEK